MGAYLVIVAVGVATAVLVVPLARRLSFRLGILARPGGRRQHEGMIPKLGGLPLLAGLLLAWGVIYWLLPPAANSDDVKLLPGVMLGTVVMALGGFWDDRYDLPAWAQTAVHLTGALIAIRFDIFIELFTSPARLLPLWQLPPLAWVVSLEAWPVVTVWRPLALLFTLFWLLGMINAVNMLDGLDGLATGVGAIAAAIFAWHSYTLQQFTVAAFSLALAGVLLGFIVFNFAPARIHLGSAGAYILGYQLATLSIISPAKFATALLVLAVPILDVAWRIFDRLRHGHSPFHGDRGHLHYLLLDSGLPVQKIVLGYYAVTIVFGLTALLLPSPGMKLVTLLVLAMAVLTLIVRLSAKQAPPQNATKGEM